MKKFLKKLMIVLTISTLFLATTVTAADLDFKSKNVITNFNKITLNSITPYKVSNTPLLCHSSFLMFFPTFLNVNNIQKIDEEWYMISYYDKETSLIMLNNSIAKEYEIMEEKNDIVIAAKENVQVYSKPYANKYSELDNIPQGEEISRKCTLKNGFSMISYNNQSVFVQTTDLAKKKYVGDYIITYYCPCSICNGSYGAVDRYGKPLTNGVAAVDPNIIPMGSTFYVEEADGLRTCVAKDVGGAIKGKHIDVFVNVPHNVCETMGNTRKAVYVYEMCT